MVESSTLAASPLSAGAAAPTTVSVPTPRHHEVEPPVSWPAILAGAVVALAISLLLTALGAGFGMSLGYSSLATRGSLGAFTPELGAYAMAAQVVSALFGGYIAGRLRPAWAIAHGDEAHFRDTAHGLIAWAVATLLGVLLAATVLAPYAEALAGAAAAAPAPPPVPTAVETERAAHIAAQASFFTAVAMLLSAFTAAVAARVGGEHTEHMHGKRKVV